MIIFSSRITLIVGGAVLAVALAGGALKSAARSEAAMSSPLTEHGVRIVSSRIIARDLQGPDGLVLRESDGIVFLAEEEANRVLCIRPNDSVRASVDHRTPVYNPAYDNPDAPLRSPEGICLSPDGRLWVAEDLPGGRLIVFTLSNDGLAIHGEVVPLPIPGHQYAWESVAIREDGALLLAGSSAESAMSSANPSAFEGILLYRDRHGRWWAPIRFPFDGISSVSFSRRGNWAYFVTENLGSVGALDLSTNVVQTRMHTHRAKVPECVIEIPDGRLAVLEEGGRLLLLNWQDESVEKLDLRVKSAESVAWDADRQTFLLSDDSSGCVRALRVEISHNETATPSFLSGSTTTRHPMMPDLPPDYLAALIRRITGHHFADADFPRLATAVKLVAIDAELLPLKADSDSISPLRRLRFASFSAGFGISGAKLFMPTCAFIAERDSGQHVLGQALSKQAIRADLWTETIENMGPIDVSLPMVGGMRMSSDGIASIHLLGLGVIPDIHVVINCLDADASYALVHEPDGSEHVYALKLPPGRDATHWVVGLKSEDRPVWERLEMPAGTVVHRIRPPNAPQVALAK